LTEEKKTWTSLFLSDMGVSKLSAKVFLKVNYSFKTGLFTLKSEIMINSSSLG